MPVLFLPQSLPLVVPDSRWTSPRCPSRTGWQPSGLEAFWWREHFRPSVPAPLSRSLRSHALHSLQQISRTHLYSPHPEVQRPWSRAGLERVRTDQGDGSNARRPGLGPAFGWGAFLPAPETRISDNACPACPGLKIWILQKGSSSIVISSVGGRQMGSRVE